MNVSNFIVLNVIAEFIFIKGGGGGGGGGFTLIFL